MLSGVPVSQIASRIHILHVFFFFTVAKWNCFVEWQLLQLKVKWLRANLLNLHSHPSLSEEVSCFSNGMLSVWKQAYWCHFSVFFTLRVICPPFPGSLSCSTSADLGVTVTANDSSDQVSPTIPRASKNRVSGKLRRSASAISKSSNWTLPPAVRLHCP